MSRAVTRTPTRRRERAAAGTRIARNDRERVSSASLLELRGPMRALVPVLACLLLGCSGYTPPERIIVYVPITVTRPPEPLAGLRIHVADVTGERAIAGGEANRVDSNTLKLRAALQSALVDAGYVLVVDPDAPHDLVAWMHADTHHYYYRNNYVELLTSLRLCTGNHEVLALSAKLKLDAQGDPDGEGMARLVESLAESDVLVEFASMQSNPALSIGAEAEPEVEPAVVKVAGDLPLDSPD
jgi:hypothetical protein